MNCKQGDVAIVVWSACGNEGKIVRCVRFAGDLKANPATGCGWVYGVMKDAWEIDPPLITQTIYCGAVISDTAPLSVFPDSCLRPLRGDLLDKETESTKELERVD